MTKKRYNKSLRPSLKRFPEEIRFFLDETLTNTPLPLVLFDKDLKIISFDNLFSQKTGYANKDCDGGNLESIIPGSLSLLKKALSRLTSQKRTEIKNIAIATRKNRKLSGSAVISVYRKNKMEIFLMYLNGLEIKKDNDLIKETSKLDDFIYHLTETGKWLLDPETRNFTGSPVCFQLLGLEPVNRTVKFIEVLSLISSREDRESLEKDVLKLKQHSQKTEREFRIKAKNSDDQSSRFIRLIFDKPDFKDRNDIAGTIEDITEYKRIEKDLLKSRNKIEKTDRFKSVFLTNLSHEIRTPMNAILGYSELLNQPGLGQKEINNYTSIIRAKGNHLLALIDDVIEISRFETGNIEFRYKEFSLHPLLKELHKEFEELRLEKGKNNIELELNVPADAEQQLIYTDYGRLHQLLSNLLSNALKFTEKGKIVFGYLMTPKNFKFFVTDTGVGLSEDDQDRIFNRFEILEDTTLRRLSGTGLSLTISKYIVEELGGKIKVKSEINKGSRFQLNIPVISPPDKKRILSDKRSLIQKHNWKDKVILIAEDEEVNYRFLETILQRTQAQILHAKNGLEAVELCKKINQIDIVLMDIKMPVVNGFDATIEIKRYRTNLPIIAQTAFASKEEINKCLELGCDDYITKPIDINGLINKINKQFIK